MRYAERELAVIEKGWDALRLEEQQEQALKFTDVALRLFPGWCQRAREGALATQT